MVKERTARGGHAPRMLRALDRKLFRDLWSVRGQAIAIALVIGAGIAVFVAMMSTFASLDLSLLTYYDRYRFGDVFVSLTRAPLALQPRLEAIPGVSQVETRVVADVTLDVPGMSEPATGRLISIPPDRRPTLCDVFLRSGRYIEAGHPDEVLLSESFALAHGLRPGDEVGAVINGRRRDLRIVGIALSPEFIYAVRPGELLPDESQFGVLWMDRRALAAAFDMEGGFNNVVLRVMRDASERDVIARLDRLLEPYGGTGAVTRALQPSHWMVQAKLDNLRAAGRIIPAIFLGVAVFLLNVVLSRIILVQRPQIATLKALGYSDTAIGAHYVKWSVIVALGGAFVGVGVGAWLGATLTRIYAGFFHFPVLLYRLDPSVAIGGTVIGLLAATLGAIGAVHRVVRLPAAEAMRPDTPAAYSESWLERLGARRLLSQPTRIILRTLQRHPGRLALAVLAIALGASLLVIGNFERDSINRMTDTLFDLAARYDAMVTFVRPTSGAALDDLRRYPGVIGVEPMRMVAARLRFANRDRTVGVTGLADGSSLNRIIDMGSRVVSLPPDGLVLSRKLADLLGVRRGQVVTFEPLEGSRLPRQVVVADTVEDYLGTNAYMNLEALHRLMSEGPTLSGAYLLVDSAHERALFGQLKATPRVAGVTSRREAIDSFNATIADALRKVQVVYLVFAAVIAFGVVYNTARISLSERSRELATLRVIGFTRGEISYILLGELIVVTIVAVPLGLALGYAITGLVVRATDTEMFRLPHVVSEASFAISAVTIALVTLVSALVVRRRLDRLDLVEVLKTRE